LPGDEIIRGEGAFGGGSSISAAAVVSLAKDAEQKGLTVLEQVALQDAETRKWMARRIVWTFIGGDVVTLVALAFLVWLDQGNIEHKLIIPSDRIVSNQVIMALLAATTVQVGTIAAIIARYLFPGRARD
jgi:hypothetical protein